MSGTQHLRALLGKRLEVVQEIARLNARQLQNRQIVSGLELEMMLCERDLTQTEDGVGPSHRLAEARARYDAAQVALDEDERDLMQWHGRLDELDREISRQ